MADPYSGPPLRMSERTAHDTLQRLAVHLAGDGGGAAAHRLDKAALRDGGHRGVADGPHGGGGGAGHLHLYRRLGERTEGEVRLVQGEIGIADPGLSGNGNDAADRLLPGLFRLREAEEAEPDEEALVTLLRTVHSCW